MSVKKEKAENVVYQLSSQHQQALFPIGPFFPSVIHHHEDDIQRDLDSPVAFREHANLIAARQMTMIYCRSRFIHSFLKIETIKKNTRRVS